ncbi:hypothetical protein BWI17_03905 [Betaproteobacteria bacterium GR16-43]|nr:hypothetical protein BWI17_03905 [Betaproteobacteria bacterium GR16-43]
MVTITPDAIAKVERFISGADPMDWFLLITWKRDEWIVDLGGWKPNKVPPDEGLPLFGDVRVLIQEAFAPASFPGGEIYAEGNEFKLRAHAI